MSATLIGRIVVPSLALVATSAAALVFGLTYVWREPPVETRAATAATAVSPAASSAPNEGAAAATAQAEANAVAAQLAISPNLPVTDASLPVFDIARVEQTGDAVIAGRAAPGAMVELLRDGVGVNLGRRENILTLDGFPDSDEFSVVFLVQEEESIILFNFSENVGQQSQFHGFDPFESDSRVDEVLERLIEVANNERSTVDIQNWFLSQ